MQSENQKKGVESTTKLSATLIISSKYIHLISKKSIWQLKEKGFVSRFPQTITYALGRAKFWNIVIFSHIVVNWGKIMRKSFVTAHIVQTCAPGTYLNITGWTNQRAEDPKQPIRGQNSIILRWIPGAQDCTMWAVTTHFLFILPQLTTIWLNITMVQNFARPNLQIHKNKFKYLKVGFAGVWLYLIRISCHKKWWKVAVCLGYCSLTQGQ